jgi:GNAT superfamily N-acetyltransferase
VPAIVLLDPRVHDRKSFDCGVEPLDQYIRERAAADVRKKAAVCYVVTPDDDSSAILGYYTLSSLSVRLSGLPDAQRRRLPKYPNVPATLIGRLAVGLDYRGQGLGEFLLLDALRRALHTSDVIGSALVVVDAKDEQAAGFYLQYGFECFATDPMRLFLPMGVVAKLFANP